jgi:hypothetical protein
MKNLEFKEITHWLSDVFCGEKSDGGLPTPLGFADHKRGHKVRPEFAAAGSAETPAARVPADCENLRFKHQSGCFCCAKHPQILTDLPVIFLR